MADAPLQLGPFDVRAEAGALAAYRAATVAGPTNAVPLAFTLRWLTAPEIRQALGTLLEADEVMVHEAQKFSLAAPLLPDTSYAMTLQVRRTESPARLNAVASVTTPTGALVLEIESVLRLVAPPPEATS
jgi:hypothetical protein